MICFFMNFFYGINNTFLKSEIQIPRFQNRYLKKSKLKLFKIYPKNNTWILQEIFQKKANDYFNETFAVVTCYSNAGIEAMLNGIPCIFTHKDRKNSDLSLIEQIEFNEQILYNLAHYQWNIKEIQSGEAWESMKKIWLKDII